MTKAPKYYVDWKAVEAARPEGWRRIDEMVAAAHKQLLAQLIPGVRYDITTSGGAYRPVVKATPIDIEPEYVPHVLAWGEVLLSLTPGRRSVGTASGLLAVRDDLDRIRSGETLMDVLNNPAPVGGMRS